VQLDTRSCPVSQLTFETSQRSTRTVPGAHSFVLQRQVAPTAQQISPAQLSPLVP